MPFIEFLQIISVLCYTSLFALVFGLVLYTPFKNDNSANLEVSNENDQTNTVCEDNQNNVNDEVAHQGENKDDNEDDDESVVPEYFIQDFVDNLSDEHFGQLLKYISTTQVIVPKFYFLSDIRKLLKETNKVIDDDTFDLIASKYTAIGNAVDQTFETWLKDNIVNQLDDFDTGCDDDCADMPPLVSDSDDDDMPPLVNVDELKTTVEKAVEEVVKELSDNSNSKEEVTSVD